MSDNQKYLGVVEFQSSKGDFHVFEIMETKTRLMFGGVCNAGFIEFGYMEKDDVFSLDESLQELVCQLEQYYESGKDSACKLCCRGGVGSVL